LRARSQFMNRKFMDGTIFYGFTGQLLLLGLISFLVSGCDRHKPVSSIAETKSTFQKIVFTQPQTGDTIKLISENQCELANRGNILLADYSREENKLRVVTRVGGTDSVSYYEIMTEGLRKPNGEVFLLPEPLNKANEQARISKETQVQQLRDEYSLIPGGDFLMGDKLDGSREQIFCADGHVFWTFGLFF